MENELMRRRIDEKLTSASLALRTARQCLQEALDTAPTGYDETLNLDILQDYHRTVTQVLSHMEQWRIPIVREDIPSDIG